MMLITLFSGIKRSCPQEVLPSRGLCPGAPRKVARKDGSAVCPIVQPASNVPQNVPQHNMIPQNVLHVYTLGAAGVAAARVMRSTMWSRAGRAAPH